MEKRNRLDRRGQSPPPGSSNRTAARVASAAALGAAFVALVWAIAASAGLGSTLLAVAGLLTVGVTAWTAWLGYKTALVNRETAEINRGLAERERSSGG